MSTITLEQALELVSFRETIPGSGLFAIGRVHGPVHGDVCGSVLGDVRGSVLGDVRGSVEGTIEGRQWQFVETPREKLKRLIDEGADTEQLIEQCVLLEQIND